MKPIADYAITGDRHTVALIGKDGSVDWLCLPRFDSASCFSALLDDPDGSRWFLGPDPGVTGDVEVSRTYWGETTVLRTEFRTATGLIRITDVMPEGDRRADLVRRVEGVEGEVALLHEFVVRFDYGRIRPWVHREGTGRQEAIVAVAGPDKVILTGPRLPRAEDGHHRDRFAVRAGDRLDFTLTCVPSHRPAPEPLDVDERLHATVENERRWIGEYETGPYDEAVRRSLLTLRLLTHEDTGGIVAAPTTSLPEDFGGERNWDYRYSWLRDAALTVSALTGSARPERAEPWRAWLLRAVAGDPEDLQVMYTVDGGRHLPEIELDHLGGYAGSRPVRIGNGAVQQRQTDVIGEVITALAQARAAGLEETRDSWALQRSLLNDLVRTWHLPDHGIWEIRGPQRHYTHSRAMVWAAFDRAVRAVEEDGKKGPVDRWREAREAVCQEILARGFDSNRNTFIQHYDTDQVDASLLVLPLTGFVKGDDPKMLGTIEAIEKDLMRDGLLMRYRTETDVDGLPGSEHPFLACSFWLVSAYAAAGRLDDANALFDRLVGLVNDVGLLSEEYDPRGRRMVGNFPQAFSHLTLVQAAFRLRAATSTVR
jgi:GH15 family glucan-1,4-alpha-glucosidase